MKNLIKIIVLLKLTKPKYYIDILDVETGEIIKKNYSKEEILEESEDITDWFSNLPLNNYLASLYFSNGSARIPKGEYYITTETYFNQKQSIMPIERVIEPKTQEPPTIYGGLNGVDMPQLLANEVLYANLKVDFSELESEYEKHKKIAEKLTKKLQKAKNKLFFTRLNNNKKSFLETETGQGLVGAIPQFLEALNRARVTGLNASEEESQKLTEQQKAFIEFIKTLSDEEIVEINTLYKQYLKDKKEVENQTQTGEEEI